MAAAQSWLIMRFYYIKAAIRAQNSTYFYYYKHIKVHLNGFIVQILVETNDIDHIKPFIAV